MDDDTRITTGVLGVGCMVFGLATVVIGVILYLIATFDPSRWTG